MSFSHLQLAGLHNIVLRLFVSSLEIYYLGFYNFSSRFHSWNFENFWVAGLFGLTFWRSNSLDVALTCCRCSKRIVFLTYWRCIWGADVTIMHWCCIVYAGVKSLDDIAFGCSLMLQWSTDVMTQIKAVVAAKQKKTFILRNIILEEFTVFTLLGSSSLRKYLSAQILVKVLRKKARPICQAKAMCKFDCYRSWSWLCPPFWFCNIDLLSLSLICPVDILNVI